MNVNLEWYRVFYHVVKEGQISKAALSLNISQPAVSQTIKNLEELLELNLLRRTPKGVILTSEGEILFQEVNRLFLQLEVCEERYLEIKNIKTGKLHIAASDTLCKYYLLPYIKEFQERYPKVKIHIDNKTTSEIISSLQEGSIDMGFINLPSDIPDNIKLTTVKTLQDCFICGNKYKDLFTGRIKLEDICKHPLILLEPGTNMRRFVDSYLLSNKISCSPELELGSVDLLTSFTASDFGISFVTRDFIPEESINRDIYIIDVEEKIPQRAIGMVTILDQQLNRAAQIFHDSFMEKKE